MLVLHADAVHDAGALVSEVRVRHLAADGTWSTAAPAPIEVSLPASGRLAYSAVALGLGGAVLVRAGSPEAPLRWPPAAARASDAGESVAAQQIAANDGLADAGLPVCAPSFALVSGAEGASRQLERAEEPDRTRAPQPPTLEDR